MRPISAQEPARAIDIVHAGNKRFVSFHNICLFNYNLQQCCPKHINCYSKCIMFITDHWHFFLQPPQNHFKASTEICEGQAEDTKQHTQLHGKLLICREGQFVWDEIDLRPGQFLSIRI